MKAAYLDIRNKIKEEPIWYDENGVPRYEKFSPDLSPNIYANEVILLEIACQYCHQKFLVEMNFCKMDLILNKNRKTFQERISYFIENKKNQQLYVPIHYGDPPRHDCNGGGETMNCDDLRIKEFWMKKKFEWQRIKKYEIEFEG